MLTNLQYRILKRLAPERRPAPSDAVYQNKCKVSSLLGNWVYEELRDKVVIDFGCGQGAEAVDLALHAGVKKVIGIDIRESALEIARQRAIAAGVAEICQFTTATSEPADAIISIDAFEHFMDPGAILEYMYGLLKPGGAVIASFSGTWFNPIGGHVFSVFPWSHLMFSEKALFQWRSTFTDDGAKTFADVCMNRMTIARFERIIQRSDFLVQRLELVPSRRLKFLHNRLTREFTTGAIRCKLTKQESIKTR